MKGQRSFNPSLVFVFVGTLIYPFIVYRYINSVSPYIIALFAILLIGLRLFSLRQMPAYDVALRTFALAGLVFILIMGLNAALAVKAYPIIVSLTFAIIFTYSLVYPPTIIERIARITRADLPPEGVAYTRKVTIIWVGFLLINAAISAVTALWGSLDQWTLWNGLLSYLAMGILFAAEYMVRRKVMR